MGFRGRPSKACQRCRDRRLKCDLQPQSCGQCLRAQVLCTGYRDTQKLRIRNESNAIRRKFDEASKSMAQGRNSVQCLPLSLDFQAREAFFTFHVTEASQTWNFLLKFYHPLDAPEHLTKSIDAVSLAFLSHQMNSCAALTSARERYGSALRLTTRALQCPEDTAKYTTMLSTLLLDMFEKITNLKERHSRAWSSHVNGAFALVNIQGFEHYRDGDALRVLGRLSTNLLISCITSESPVPLELVALRQYIAGQLQATDAKWELTGLMIEFAKLRTQIRQGYMSVAECMEMTLALDAQLHALSLDVAPAWQYTTTMVAGDSERVFGRRADAYAGRHVTQTWNVLRTVRITLNRWVTGHCMKLQDASDTYLSTCMAAMETIDILAREVCASVPQYVDCAGVAADEMFSDAVRMLGVASHSHSPSQLLDCYILIFPIYVAAHSQPASSTIRAWCVTQLHYMANHFGIRNAAFVGRILERGIDMDPWAVYAGLGSYAFVT